MIANQVTQKLHPEFKSLLEIANHAGFKVGLIGGFIRDTYLERLGQKFPDYDCELRPVDGSAQMLDTFEALFKKLSKTYKCDRLPYNIIIVKHEGFEAEFSLPRIETYNQDFHHSNFEAQFIEDRDYSKGFLRRDLTINAVMVEFYNNEATLVDPLNGINDLEAGVLRPCSANFYKDPVRFLRAIRFSLLLSTKSKSFEIIPEVESAFLSISLKDFTPHYLKYEMFKSSRPLSFLNKLTRLLDGNATDLKKELLDDFDALWMQNKKVPYFKNALFLSIEIRQSLQQQLALGVKKFMPQMPWKLITKNIDSAWVEKFEFLVSTSHELTEFYFQHQLIDLSQQEISEITKIEVDLSQVSNSERKLFNYSEKMRSYLANKND